MPNPPVSTPPRLEPRDWIAGLEKGLSVIEAFDDQHPRLTASQAGARCGLTRTAARRYLLTLAHLGYVGSDGKLFWLTPRILRLGHAYLESARLPRVVQPFLQRIAGGTQEIAYLGVLDGDDVVYIARSGAHRHMNTGYMLGSRIQAQLSTAGVAILAAMGEAAADAWLEPRELHAFTPFTMSSKEQLRSELQRFRRQGWALLEQQLELNARGIAVPLLDRNNAVQGAISITMPINQESSEDAIKRVLPVLQEAARTLRNLI
ncbi:helix-turn-helix domain-containing protein [Hydrogenophaga taeniospiralis]|uniref:IclR family transcriptional regulator domain-containing protein n=1 Tax=Hydrogenophaga taeniospiralis TaxID=65656 RepID=UPI001CFC310B|nr:IclR family transcriptional regulator C-terminal domain-containing protein [Hydrogenophaga taeniospiralis]MCB4364648.1 helix-turn-helix domain-containing protein [Hydrogenophaga taeniospiralis]